jgi:hypothetical protein
MTAFYRARTAALATALFCTTVLTSTSAMAEPAAASQTAAAQDPAPQLAAGIGLMILGSGAFGGATLFALARQVGDNAILDDPTGPSGGTLAIIAGIGLAGAAVGLGLTISAQGKAPEAKASTAPTVSATFSPGGAMLRIRF